MGPNLFKAIEENGACIDLSNRAKLRFSGADRVRYLNGQLTNDVRRVTAQAAQYACVTTAKGRIEADVFVHADPAAEALLLDAEPDLREPLALRLEKYIVSDDATLTDVTDEWKLLHIFGTATATVDKWIGSPLPISHRVNATRFGEPGVDLWIPASATLPAWPGQMLSAEDAETLRVLHGIPRWSHELNTDAFPQEAGLEDRAMDFFKGCYIGQETLSRIKTTGKMPRVLVQWTAQDKDAALPAELPQPLHRKDEGGTRHEVGVITSAVRHPVSGHWTGLGYVKQGQAHSVLLAGSGAPSICIDVNYLKA
jgi:folate-binding protein YgfZ